MKKEKFYNMLKISNLQQRFLLIFLQFTTNFRIFQHLKRRVTPPKNVIFECAPAPSRYFSPQNFSDIYFYFLLYFC